jgi:hypothetical protein
VAAPPANPLNNVTLPAPHPQTGSRRARRNQPGTADTFTNADANGLWSDANNWSAGEPNSSDNVLITGTGSAAAATQDVNDTVDDLALNSGDSLGLNNGITLTLDGTAVRNAGTINLNASAAYTGLYFNGNVILSGAGTVNMSDDVHNYLQNGSGTFVNQSTIQGTGTLYPSGDSFANSGVINATSAAGNPITISMGGQTFTNTGTMEATGGGALVLTGTNYANTRGTIAAFGAGSTVQLNQPTITGGTFTSSGGGVIESTENYTTLDGVTISAGSTYEATNDSITNLEGTITNNGSILVQNTGNGSSLDVANSSGATLQGSGTVTLSDAPYNYNYIGLNNGNLTNHSTIQGAGTINTANNVLTNTGTIDATSTSGNALLIQTGGAPAGVTNTGILEATGGAPLVLQGLYNNTNGTIKAVGAGSTVQLNQPTITGGTLSSSNGGLIESVANYTTLNGVTISAGSTYEVVNDSITNLEGTITNNGSILVQSTGNNGSSLDVANSSGATLQGSGTVTLSDAPYNYIGLNNGNLTNHITIQGAGTITTGNNVLTNTGTINATSTSGNMLLIQTGGAPAGLTNTGTLEATGGAQIQLNGNYTNTGGTIQAVGAGSIVELNQPTITGGTFTSSGGGIIESLYETNLSNLSISSGSTVVVTNTGYATTISGTIRNNGSILVGQGTNGNGALFVPSNTTLSGSGTVTLSNSSGNSIFGGSNNAVFTNASTIQGGGTIGSGNIFDLFTIVNSGKIIANQSTPLIIQGYNASPTGSGLLNTGTLQATGGATMQIDQTGGSGLFTNNGTLNVGTSSTMTISGGSGYFANYGGGGNTYCAGPLTGGTYTISGTLNINVTSLCGGSNQPVVITSNAANITLNGTAAAIYGNGVNALSWGGTEGAWLQTNNAGATLSLQGGASVAEFASGFVQDAPAFQNSGTLTIGKLSSFTLGGGNCEFGWCGASYTQLSGGKMTVDGTLTVSNPALAGPDSINIQGGSVFGNGGTISGVVLNSSGSFNIGDALLTPGKVRVSGTYQQTSGGALTIDIGGAAAGTQFDQLTATQFMLGGTLNIDLINSFVPTVDESFVILTGGPVTGTFATVNGVAINSGEHFEVVYSTNSVGLKVVSGQAMEKPNRAPSFAPENLTYAVLKARSSNQIETLTLTNNPSVPLAIQDMLLDGPAAGDFAFTSDCPNTLLPGAECTISVMFAPVKAGARTATLVITDSAGQQSIPLSGFGR